MSWIAIRMLTGDRIKFLGLLFGIAFSTLLITQQLTIFVNLLDRGGSPVDAVGDVDIWVMDPASRTVDLAMAMPDTALPAVRGVPVVAWAVPMLRANAPVRTREGKLESVGVVGVDDTTLIGLPPRLVSGNRAALFDPDAVFIDVGGAEQMFGKVDPVGQELELNDRRAMIRGVIDVNPSFASSAVLYTRYSNALGYVPGSRKRLSFVLARAAPGRGAEEAASAITRATGLKARTARAFAQDGIDYLVANTGIPINFAITVTLGVIVGAAIVGLTFSLFIRDSIRQFGVLKAIGVGNGRIRLMLATQAGLVAVVGYGVGLFLATMFVTVGGSFTSAFKGFYMPWQIPLFTAGLIAAMILVAGAFGVRAVVRTDPAEVFR